MNAPLSTDQHARRIKLYRALYEWKDYGGPMEDVLDAIGEYVIGVLNDQLARPAGDVPVKHDPKCKPDFPFHLCPVCYPGL